MAEKVRRDFPPVATARFAFVTKGKDLIPEGLAYDEEQNLYYLGSLNRKKIVKIDSEGRISDFVPGDRYGLLPVLGIRLDPADGTGCSLHQRHPQPINPERSFGAHVSRVFSCSGRHKPSAP